VSVTQTLASPVPVEEVPVEESMPSFVQLWCGHTRYDKAIHKVEFRTDGGPEKRAAGMAKHRAMGNGVECQLAPHIGDGELGVFATEFLPKGTWFSYEAMLVDSSWEELLDDCKSHAVALSYKRGQLLLGVRVSPKPVNVPVDAWVKEVNKQLSGLGCAQLMNSSGCLGVKCNAKKKEVQLSVTSNHHGGGGVYSSVNQCKKRVCHSLIVVELSEDVYPGQEITWLYTIIKSAAPIATNTTAQVENEVPHATQEEVPQAGSAEQTEAPGALHGTGTEAKAASSIVTAKRTGAARRRENRRVKKACMRRESMMEDGAHETRKRGRDCPEQLGSVTDNVVHLLALEAQAAQATPEPSEVAWAVESEAVPAETALTATDAEQVEAQATVQPGAAHTEEEAHAQEAVEVEATETAAQEQMESTTQAAQAEDAVRTSEELVFTEALTSAEASTGQMMIVIGTKVTYTENNKRYRATVSAMNVATAEYSLSGSWKGSRFTHCVPCEAVSLEQTVGTETTTTTITTLAEHSGRTAVDLMDALGELCPLRVLSLMHDGEPGMWRVKSAFASGIACAVGGTLSAILGEQEHVSGWLDRMFAYMRQDGAKEVPTISWMTLFRRDLVSGEFRDKFRHMAQLKTFQDKFGSMQERQRAIGLLEQVAFKLAKSLEGFSGVENVSVLVWGVLRSRPGGSWRDVVARAQRYHRDCSRSITAEFGPVHSLFVGGPDDRYIRIVCPETGEEKLMYLEAYGAGLLHGRWVHSGFGIPRTLNARDAYVLFAHVVMTPIGTIPGCWVSTKAWKINKVFMVLTEEVALDENATSLDFDKAVVGTCSQCCVGKKTLHPCFEHTCARRMCFPCMMKHGERKCDQEQLDQLLWLQADDGANAESGEHESDTVLAPQANCVERRVGDRSQNQWAIEASISEAERVAASKLGPMLAYTLCLILSHMGPGALVWIKQSQGVWLAVLDEKTGVRWIKGMTNAKAQALPDLLQQSQVTGFLEGCQKGLLRMAISSGHSGELRVVCRALGPHLYKSFEVLQGMLNASPVVFRDNFVKQLKDDGWQWSAACKIGLGKEEIKDSVDVYLKATKLRYSAQCEFKGWRMECDPDSFVSLWKCCIRQQMRQLIAQFLEVVIVVLCTLRETDFKSLTLAAAAIKLLRANGGVVQCISSCMQHCKKKKCVGTCVLFQSFVRTFKQSEDGNVKTMRDLSVKCPWTLLDENKVISAQTLESYRQDFISVHGVGPVVYEKVCSLIRVGTEAGCGLIMAIDSRLECCRTGIPPGAEAEDHGERFTFTPTEPWAMIAREWSDRGLDTLAPVAEHLGRVLRERLVYATNAARSMVAAHIQEVEPNTAKDFCDYYVQDSHDNAVVTGLRETLRFIFLLCGLLSDDSKGTGNKAIVLAKVKQDNAAIEQSEPRLWVTKEGVVFGYMEEWLHDEDVAAWWCHPGQLVKLTGKTRKLTNTDWAGTFLLTSSTLPHCCPCSLSLSAALARSLSATLALPLSAAIALSLSLFQC
jgi:hypothetical protein